MIEFGRSTVHSNRHILTRLVSGSFNSSHDGVKSVFRSIQSRSETTFVTDSRTQTAIVQHLLQSMEDFGPHTQTFTETASSNRTDHKFLESDRGIRMRTAIDNIHHRDRQYICIRPADITVKRQVQIVCCRLGNSQRNA